MGDFKELQRIYSIKLEGVDDATSKLEKFGKLLAAKQSAEAQASKQEIENLRVKKLALDVDIKQAEIRKKQSAEEANALVKITQIDKNLAQQKAIEAKADIEAKRSIAQLDAANAKLAADAKIKDAQAAKLLAQAEDARLKSLIAQDKELDRQIDREEKRAAQIKKQNAALQAQIGSVLEARKAYQELYKIVEAAPAGSSVNFRGASLDPDQAIAKLKELSTVEQNFRRQFSRDGLLVGEYTSGIVQAFKELNIDDILRQQVTGAKEQITQLEQKTKDLVVAYRQAQVSGSEDLNKLQHEIHENVTETQKLKTAVASAQTELRGLGGVGAQISEGINKNFKELRSNITNVALGFVGFQAVFAGIQNGIENAKELSDQTSNLEVELGKTKGGAAALVNELSKLDTRTKLTALEDITNIAAKAGVSEQNLLGVTQAIDKIKIAFGKDFGDVETGTESLVKLINIFLGPSAVTGDNLLKMGNAIRTLANESVASVPFLNDFSKRMAGLKGIADISLPSVLGLASGFEQFGQSAEVSSTALVKIIPKLANDTEKFAKIAGVTQKEFSELLKNNPAEALIKVSEGLVKNTGSLEEFAAAFKDTELGTGRVESIIGVLGKNSESFRKSIDSASEAFENTSNIETAFAAKNENLAASLDKIGKKFADAANSNAFKNTVTALSAVIILLLNNIPGLLILVGVLTAAWAAQNAQLLLLRGSMLVYNLLIARNYVAMAALTVLQTAYNVVLFVMNGALTVGTRVLALFGVTLRATSGPLGVVLTLVSLVATALIGFSKSMAAAGDAIDDHTRKLRLAKDIHQQASAAILDTKSKIEGYASVVRDTTLSESARLLAMRDLIAIDPTFSKALQGNKIDMDAFNSILKEVNENLLQKAELEAAQGTQQAAYADVTRLKLLKDQLEIAQKLKKGFGDLSSEQQDLFTNKTSVGRTSFTSSLLNSSISDADFNEVFKNLKQRIESKNKELDLSTELMKEKYQKVGKTITDGKQVVSAAAETGKPGTLSLDDLQGQLKTVNEEIKQMDLVKNKTDFQLKKLKELRLQRLEIIREIKELGGSVPGSNTNKNGSRLTGDQKDDFRDIDAVKDTLIADQKKLFLELGIDEKAYLNNVLQINLDASNKKLALLKGKNAEERKVIAELNLQKVTDQQETNKRLFEIDNQKLEADLKNAIQQQQAIIDAVDKDPSLSNEAKFNAKQHFLDEQLSLQIVFNQEQAALEKKYGQDSVQNAQKRQDSLDEITRKSKLNKADGPAAQLKDIADDSDIALDKIKQNIAEQTLAVLNSKESAYRKSKQLDELERRGTIQVLQAEYDAQKKATDAIIKLHNQKLVSEKDYQGALKELKEKEAALHKATTDSETSQSTRFKQAILSVRDAFLELALGIKQYSHDAQGESEKTADAVNQALQTVNQTITRAISGYFDLQKQQIDQQAKVKEDALDAEKEKVLSTATTEEQKSKIEAKYDLKRKALEKETSEEKRKNALKELTINFALAVGKTFAQFGFPLGLIPAAALGIQFAVERALINKQQFAQGGLVLGNGLIRNTPNIPQLSNGDNILATVRRGEVILNEDQQRRAGGESFFKSLGVPGFALGGPVLGQSLQAPVNPASYLFQSTNNGMRDDLSAMMNLMIQMNAETAARIDRIQVLQDPYAAQKSQAKAVKQSKIGSL